MNKRTIAIKLLPTPEQAGLLSDMQRVFADACAMIVPFAVEHRCHNRVALHHLSYYAVREKLPALGSQMVCNAIYAICQSYKSLIKSRPELKKQPLPSITFKPTGSVHFDKRTCSIKGDTLSLFTLSGRAKVAMQLGDFQRDYLARGTVKEAELVRKRSGFFFHLVLDLPDTDPLPETGKVLGVDLGENNLAATSSGKLSGGGQLCFERDQFLALRRRLQRNGSQSAKQLLCKVSGREARHVTHINHEVSKEIVQEASRTGCSTIAMESLTHIRQRIKAGKRMRSRLHRWAWAELQTFVEYKAQAAGIRVIYVNPAYTSQTCAACGELGSRSKHRFSCSHCGSLAHSDLNAGRNLARLGATAVASTGAVYRPHVAGVTA